MEYKLVYDSNRNIILNLGNYINVPVTVLINLLAPELFF